MAHPNADKLEWEVQILALLIRDLDGKKPYNANFNGECDICNERLKIGEIFYFVGQKERMCSKCKLKIQGYFEAIIDKISTVLSNARMHNPKLIVPN